MLMLSRKVARFILWMKKDIMLEIHKIIGPYVTMFAIGESIELYNILIDCFGPQYGNAIMVFYY